MAMAQIGPRKDRLPTGRSSAAEAGYSATAVTVAPPGRRRRPRRRHPGEPPPGPHPWSGKPPPPRPEPPLRHPAASSCGHHHEPRRRAKPAAPPGEQPPGKAAPERPAPSREGAGSPPPPSGHRLCPAASSGSGGEGGGRRRRWGGGGGDLGFPPAAAREATRGRGGVPNIAVHLVYTPLSYAISASSLKCMELLIKAGADVNAGRPVVTPLITAAFYGFTCGIKCLLEAGADTNITDEYGRTAADIAATQGWMDCIEILSPLTASAGADDHLLDANDGLALKEQGDAAFQGNDYADALALYTKAMEINPDDSTLYAKRSLCWLHMSEEDKALDDAYAYRPMKTNLSNSCCEQAAALLLVKEYARACSALASALKLDLRSDDLD